MEKKKGKWALITAVLAGSYAVLSVLFQFRDLAENWTWETIWEAFMYQWPVKLAVSGCIAVLASWLPDSSLDIEAQEVGHGQHGTARWAADRETEQMYPSLLRGSVYPDHDEPSD